MKKGDCKVFKTCNGWRFSVCVGWRLRFVVSGCHETEDDAFRAARNWVRHHQNEVFT